MSNIGNKGKFSDRLKKMKLIRYAKIMHKKEKDSFLVNDEEVLINNNRTSVNKSFDNNNIRSEKDNSSNIEDKENISKVLKKKAISGVSVGAAVVGAVGVNLLGGNSQEITSRGINSSVDNLKTNDDNNNIRSEKDNSSNIEDKENISKVFKRKAISGASVGAAVVGAVGVNLLGGNSQEITSRGINSSVDNLKTNDDINNKDVVKDYKNRNVDFGNDKDSFKRVLKTGKDYIVIDKISDEDIINGDRKTYLASQIIKKIKREFEYKLNELEVLESELYLLNEQNENELDLDKCKEIKKEINELILKINHIIEQYNIYQCNNFLVDMLDIDDSTLVDDISDFKRLYEGAEIQRRLVSDYELISEYQLLYNRLDTISDKVSKIQKNNNDKIIDYDKRDKEYENIKNYIVDTSRIQENYELYIKKQNDYIDSISDKVSKINVDYDVRYKLKGFGGLVSSALRYLNVMFFSPTMPILSRIALRNFAANQMVNNLRKTMRFEKVTSVVYRVEDFNFQLNDKINTLDYNYECVYNTLDNIKKLKGDFMEQYNYDIPGYNETLRNINELEVMMYDNKEKLDLIRNKLKNSKKLNEETLKKVKVLEKNSESVVERV